MAARFDWRKHEIVGSGPDDARPDHWPDFRSGNVYKRYDSAVAAVAGYEQWQAFVRTLEELGDGAQEEDGRLQAFDTFLARLPPVQRSSGPQPAPTCCLFISHQ